MPGLNITDVVNVSVNLSPTAIPVGNFGALLILGSTLNVIDTTQRIRSYSSLTQAGADFPTGSPEYQAATLFFSQTPQPTTLFIGKWAQAATSGVLHGASTSTALSTLTAITNGSMNITVDGVVKTLTGMNFSAAGAMTGIASVVQTALAASATCTWNASYNRFEIVSSTSGTSSTLTVASPTGSGTDVSGLLGLTAGAGANTVAGIAAETLATAVQTLAAISNAWYGLAIAVGTVADSDIVSAAQIVEALSPRRFMVATTQNVNALSSSSTTDLAALLQAANLTHTACQYSSSSPYAGVSLFARQASVDFTANNSTITLAFKAEPGVTAETLTETQAATLKTKNCNVFVNYQTANNTLTAIIQDGKVASGNFIDSIVGTDWLQNALQTAVFNLLYTSLTKIPQTDAGVNQIINALDSGMQQAAANGLIGPGAWTGPAVGNLASGQTLPQGYYIYAPTIASQSAAARGARQSPTLTIAARLAGAIHSVNVVVNVAN